MSTAQKEIEATKAQEVHKEEEKEIDPSVSCLIFILCEVCFSKLNLVNLMINVSFYEVCISASII